MLPILEVGPDGALYFVTGGRGTAGNIYRVAWKGHEFDEKILGTGIDRVLRQPQLNSSWARQRMAKLQEQLGDKWNALIAEAALDTNRPNCRTRSGVTRDAMAGAETESGRFGRFVIRQEPGRSSASCLWLRTDVGNRSG